MDLIHPIEPRHFQGREFAVYWEGFLTEEDINFILAEPEWLQPEQGRVGTNANVASVVEETRISDVAWWRSNPKNIHIWNKIAGAVATVNSKFFNFDITGLYEPAQLTAYHGNVNGLYNWHNDYSLQVPVPRKLTMVLMLSDPEKDFTGGEFQVKISNDEPTNLKLKRGRAWFFPSFLLHKVFPVTSGLRRTVVLWVGGPDFR